MNEKFLFVGEYEDSYTGGSVVFISTEKFLHKFESNGLKIILDSFNVQLRKIRNFPLGCDSNCNGITPEHFWELVSDDNFTEEFKRRLKIWLADDDKYPGFNHNKNIRVDWFPQNEDGIYIVYKKLVDSTSDVLKIISDTYYCA